MIEYVVTVRFVSAGYQHQSTRTIPSLWKGTPGEFLVTLREGLLRHGATDVQLSVERRKV